jgi:hypothetical protein
MTARELITMAFKVSGIRSPEENPSDEDVNLGLFELNGLVDQLRMDELWPSSSKVYTWSTTSGKKEYTIGVPVSIDPLLQPDIAIDIEIPRIDHMQVYMGNVWVPLKELSTFDYYGATQNDKAQTVPTTFAYNHTKDPYAKILLLTPSNAIWQMRIACTGYVPNYQLDDDINLPSGYAGCMQYGLAAILCSAYAVDDTKVAGIYLSRLTRIKKMNSEEPPQLKLGGGNRRYDIYSDTIISSTGGY